MKEASSVKTVNAPIGRVYAVLSDLENLRPVLERVAADEGLRSKLAAEGHDGAIDSLRNVALTRDSIEIPASAAGTVRLVITEREENKCVKFETEKSPVKAAVWVQVLPQGETQTALKLTVDADIPIFLKPMIGSKMKAGVERMADMLAVITY
ncbi:MAG: SRPBCC family protein [Prevotella sp.]|nr:SRPBCC family protein [Prevotella sp.]